MVDIFFIIYSLIIYITYPLGIFSVILAQYKIPTLIQYGKTLTTFKQKNTNPIMNILFNLQVNRKWFIHFYIISSVLSGLNSFFEYKYSDSNNLQITINNLYFIHSMRRLIETNFQNKKSIKTSYMNISHYLVGLWLYINFNYLQFYTKILPLIRNKNIIEKSVNPLLIILFLFLQYLQTIHHNHLRSLVKYSIPYKHLFKYVYSPHYFVEILIYLNLMIIDNFSIITILPFVWTLINLSVSAKNTENWYIQKFGIKKKDNINSNNKKSIIPFLI